MREYEMETTFDVPLQTFLRVVYGDDGQCLRQYHASCGNCEDATVPAWDVSISDRSSALHGVVGSRTIAFSKPMALPSVVERLLGMTRAGKHDDSREGLSFVEKQTLEVDAVTGNVRVRSAASLDVARVGPERADRFDATVEITYASIRADIDSRGVSMYGASPERTAMAARITVNAAGAWALQPVVERVMEHRAVAGFREWVVWTDEFVEKTSLGASGFAATLPSLSALGLGSLPPVTDAVTDLGFERSERLSERAGSARKKAPSEETDAMNGRGARVPDRTASSHQSGRNAKKKYPATPGASRRASLSVEEGGPSSDVPEPPNIGSGTSDDVSDVTDVTDVSDDADLFDDAASTRSGASSFKSFKSAASFASARSSASATTSSRSARAPDDPDGHDGSTTVGPSEHDAVDGVDELPPPERSRNELPGERDASDRRGTAEEPRTPTRSRRGGVSAGSPARLDDAYRDGWFMQTVMNDLTALKTGAGEQSRVVAALEARVRALAAEHARLKAELRRGAGFRLEHRGDAAYASGGRGASLARWTAALSLAAAAGYVLAAAARERR